ncbi:MAG: hypothetical protein FWE04_05245 [Oscillospiraceae bacterium]|nr:hypothetical protein [Oscillospiraceae bacterium]
MKKLLAMFITIIFLTSILAGTVVASATGTEQSSPLPPIQIFALNPQNMQITHFFGDNETAVRAFFPYEYWDIALSAFESLLNQDLWSGGVLLGGGFNAFFADLTGDGIYNIIFTYWAGSGNISFVVTVFDIPGQRAFFKGSVFNGPFGSFNPHARILDGEFISYRIFGANSRVVVGDLVIEDDELHFVERTAGVIPLFRDTWELRTGTYIVHGTVEITHRLRISGDVTIILADGSHLDASRGGIRVSEGNSLTIYAQSEDEATMGRLTAHGIGGAGIGGNDGDFNGVDGENAGTITINGGNITATGSGGAPGIGGGNGFLGGHGGYITFVMHLYLCKFAKIQINHIQQALII